MCQNLELKESLVWMETLWTPPLVLLRCKYHWNFPRSKRDAEVDEHTLCHSYIYSCDFNCIFPVKNNMYVCVCLFLKNQSIVSPVTNNWTLLSHTTDVLRYMGTISTYMYMSAWEMCVYLWGMLIRNLKAAMAVPLMTIMGRGTHTKSLLLVPLLHGVNGKCVQYVFTGLMGVLIYVCTGLMGNRKCVNIDCL